MIRLVVRAEDPCGVGKNSTDAVGVVNGDRHRQRPTRALGECSAIVDGPRQFLTILGTWIRQVRWVTA